MYKLKFFVKEHVNDNKKMLLLNERKLLRIKETMPLHD